MRNVLKACALSALLLFAAPAASAITIGASPAVAGPPVSHVVFFYGDSQNRGTASDQNAGIWPGNNGHIWIYNQSGAFVLANPGVSGFSGLDFGLNTTGMGPWMGFAVQWMTSYPSIDLYRISDSASGSYQSIGVTIGTANVSITNPNTLTVNSGTVNGNDVITGTGLVDSSNGGTLYSPFSGFVSTVGKSANAVVTTVSSVTATRYNGTISWSSGNGLVWNGNSASITNGARYRALSALTLVPGRPQIDCLSMGLGTNDMGNTTTGNLFGGEGTTFISRLYSDLPMQSVRITWGRPLTGATASTVVRNAVVGFQTANPLVRWLNWDTYPLSVDGVHLAQAGLNAWGVNVGSANGCRLWA